MSSPRGARPGAGALWRSEGQSPGHRAFVLAPPPQRGDSGRTPAHIPEGRLTGAVQLHRRQAQLLGDVCVLDGQGFLHLRGGWGREAVSGAVWRDRCEREGPQGREWGMVSASNSQRRRRTLSGPPLVCQGCRGWGWGLRLEMYTAGRPGWARQGRFCEPGRDPVRVSRESDLLGGGGFLCWSVNISFSDVLISSV